MLIISCGLLGTHVQETGKQQPRPQAYPSFSACNIEKLGWAWGRGQASSKHHGFIVVALIDQLVTGCIAMVIIVFICHIIKHSTIIKVWVASVSVQWIAAHSGPPCSARPLKKSQIVSVQQTTPRGYMQSTCDIVVCSLMRFLPVTMYAPVWKYGPWKIQNALL